MWRDCVRFCHFLEWVLCVLKILLMKELMRVLMKMLMRALIKELMRSERLVVM